MVWEMLEHQGGLLSNTTQESHWSHSPSPLGLVLVNRRPQGQSGYARDWAPPT